jgi:hypothetical protein
LSQEFIKLAEKASIETVAEFVISLDRCFSIFKVPVLGDLKF